MNLPLVLIIVIAIVAAVAAVMADLPLAVIIGIAAGAVLCIGMVFTLRGFKASAAHATGADKNGAQPDNAGQAATSRRHPASTELLKRYFDGKACAICKQPIAPVPRTGLKPGLLNPKTHQAYSWDECATLDLPSALDSVVPVCSACQVAESFRQRFPDLVVDR